MKVYKFKCKNCGSNKYKKVDKTTYKCLYCGNTEEVFVEEEPKETPRVEPEHVETHDHDEGTIVYTRRGAHKINTWKLVLILCCMFGGYFGLHRFMQGKILSGLLYVFTGGLFGIGYVIDLIRLIFDYAKDIRNV